MKTSGRYAVILSTACLLGGSAATLAAPSRVGEVATKTVKFADLDLSTADGAQALYERLVPAARSVCRDPDVSLKRDCRTRAVEAAVSRSAIRC